MLEIAGIALGAVTAIFQWLNRRAMKTNHGKRPGEYLEMVAELKADLAAHTIQDADNFSKLSAQLGGDK